jgi:uncharacterized membrane protein
MDALSKSLNFIHKLRVSENLENRERAFALGSGTLLTAMGVNRGGFGGFLCSMIGGSLAYHGLSGKNPFYKTGRQSDQHVFIRQSVLINESREVIYHFWRDLKNLPKIMKHVKNVDFLDEYTTKWDAELGGIETSWKAEIVFDVENWRISWNSTPDSQIQNSGKVEFEKIDDNFTRLNVLISYEPKFGELGIQLAKVLNPVFEEEVREDILRMKKLFE